MSNKGKEKIRKNAKNEMLNINGKMLKIQKGKN